MRSIFTCLIFLSVFWSCGPVTDARLSKTEEKFKKAWFEIGNTETVCEGFDYFPDGGIRSFACHGANIVTLKEINDSLGPVYRSGPHSSSTLNLNAVHSFGHYNPDFIKKLRKTALPARNDSAFRLATQSIYNTYMRDLARIHFVTYKKIQAQPDWRKKELQKYKDTIARNQRYDYEPFFFFMNPEYPEKSEDYLWKNGFDGGFSGNVVKTAVAFWLRRHMDNSAEEFFAALEEMISIYDEDFLYVEP